MFSDRTRFFKVEPLEQRLLLSATPMIDVTETESALEVVMKWLWKTRSSRQPIP